MACLGFKRQKYKDRLGKNGLVGQYFGGSQQYHGDYHKDFEHCSFHHGKTRKEWKGEFEYLTWDLIMKYKDFGQRGIL